MLDVENHASTGLLAGPGKAMDGTRGGAQQAEALAQADVDMVQDRATAAYVNEDAPFRINQRLYERQYAQLYFARLRLMAEALEKEAARRWPGVQQVKILEVGGREEGLPCCVVGTLYKEQKLKPSILDEYTKDRGLKAALAATTFCSDDDTAALEDEGGRMLLKGTAQALPVQQLVTGLVLAVRGQNQLGGDFEVHEVLYPGMAPQPPLPPAPPSEGDKLCVLMSGLRLSNAQSDLLQLHLALDLLSGHLGGEREQQQAASVVRVVLAGGCIGALDTLASTQVHSNSALGRLQTQQAVQPLKDLDMYLSELAGAVPVDLMPGADDPTNVAMPQQPFNRCLLPASCKTGAVVPSTNPHAFTLDGVRFLGTSGQPVEDVAKYSSHPDRLSVLEACLRWRHLSPTAPDTLASYPFYESDPFIIASTPHVLFAGNQPEFATKVATGAEGQSVRVVCVPSFSRTGVLVAVNLRTLEARPIHVKGPDAA